MLHEFYDITNESLIPGFVSGFILILYKNAFNFHNIKFIFQNKLKKIRYITLILHKLMRHYFNCICCFFFQIFLKLVFNCGYHPQLFYLIWNKIKSLIVTYLFRIFNIINSTKFVLSVKNYLDGNSYGFKRKKTNINCVFLEKRLFLFMNLSCTITLG